MRVLGITAGAVLSLAAAEPALAAQCATVGFSPGTVTLPSFDPIAGDSVQASFTATITRVNATTTSVRLIFTDSDDTSAPLKIGVTAGYSGPSYQILDPAGALASFPRNTLVTGATNRKITLPQGTSGDAVPVSYLLTVLPNTTARDYHNGSYGETISYSIECFQGKTSQGSDTGVTGPVLSEMIPNLVSITTASPQTLDFQNFTTLSQQLDVGLKSTGPIDVQLATDNGRKMVLSGAPAPVPSNSYISYAIKLNNQKVTTDPYILSDAPRVGVAGKNWPLLLSLPSQPSGKLAGSYRDTITLTLTPGS